MTLCWRLGGRGSSWLGLGSLITSLMCSFDDNKLKFEVSEKSVMIQLSYVIMTTYLTHCSGQTDRHTDRQTDRQTDLAVELTPPSGGQLKSRIIIWRYSMLHGTGLVIKNALSWGKFSSKTFSCVSKIVKGPKQIYPQRDKINKSPKPEIDFCNLL